MRQQTFSSQAGFEEYGRKTRRGVFLDEMNKVVPWPELEALVRPHYHKGANGRPPVGLSAMLRVYFLQQWFNLSNPCAEDALYESSVLRRFAGVDLGRAPEPDETTILNFRHLLERHELGGRGESPAGAEGHSYHQGHDCGRDHSSCAFLDQKRERRARSPDAPDEEGQPVVLRNKAACGRGREVGHRAFGVFDGGLGCGQAHCWPTCRTARSARQGRRRVSGAGRNHPPGSAAYAGHDLAPDQIQRLY